MGVGRLPSRMAPSPTNTARQAPARRRGTSTPSRRPRSSGCSPPSPAVPPAGASTPEGSLRPPEYHRDRERWPMNVEGILRSKGATVVTIKPDATVGDLVRGLREDRIGAMVVSEDGRSVLGIISERDVVRGLAERGPRILEAPVAELMTRQVVSCAP